MRRPLLALLILSGILLAPLTRAATGRVLKVLPEFLDLKGRNSLAPSLYERDAYQVILRDHPEKRSGMKFFVQWRIKGAVWEPLIVRLEIRGGAKANLPKQLVFDQAVQGKGGWLSHWTDITLRDEDYKDIGGVTAWRVSLWEGATLLGEQRSFLW